MPEPEDWEPGPPWRVVGATRPYDTKFEVLDVEHTGKEEEMGAGAFSLPIIITICLVIAILASLLYFLLRRACFPSDRHLVDAEDHPEKNGKMPPV